jgi:hypothetical protein
MMRSSNVLGSQATVIDAFCLGSMLSHRAGLASFL